MGMGTTMELFHIRGTVPSEIEKLKIIERGIDRASEHFLKIIGGSLSIGRQQLGLIFLRFFATSCGRISGKGQDESIRGSERDGRDPSSMVKTVEK